MGWRPPTCLIHCCRSPLLPLKLQSLFEAEQQLDLVTSPKELTRYLKIEGGILSSQSGRDDVTRERVLLLEVHDDRGMILGSVDNNTSTPGMQQATVDAAACRSALLATWRESGGCITGTLALSSIMEPSSTLLEPPDSGAGLGVSGSGAGSSGSSQGWGLRSRQEVQDALVTASAGLLDGVTGDQQGAMHGSRVGDQLGWLALQQVRVVLAAARGSEGQPEACLAALALCSVGHCRFSVLNDCS